MSTSITPDTNEPEVRRATTFGMRLKQERERRGITLDQISQSTKIGTRFLQALEQDHFEQLPGGIFNKGFVRAYARFVGINEEQAVTDYLTATGANQPASEADDRAPAIEPPPGPERNRAAAIPWGILATLLLIIAAVFAMWGFYSRVTAARGQSPAPEPAQTAAPGAPVPQQTETTKNLTPSAAPPRTSLAPAPSTIPPANSAQPKGSTSMPEAAPRDLVLRIKTREEAWVSINVDGEVTTQETLSALSEKIIRARQQITLRAGNSGALDLEFQGKPLPTQGRTGEVKTLTFTAAGWHAVVPRSAPDAPSETPP